MGEDQPIATDEIKQGRYRMRRVEVTNISNKSDAPEDFKELDTQKLW